MFLQKQDLDFNNGLYKTVLVQLKNGQQEWRFCLIEQDHSTLVKTGEVAKAATTIALYDNEYYKIINPYSMTLMMGLGNYEKELSKFIGIPIKKV